MSVEIPEGCNNCPRVCSLQNTLAQFEAGQDVLINAKSANLDDELTNLLDGTPPSTDDPQDRVEALKGILIDVQLQGIVQMTNRFEGLLTESTRNCVGSVALRGAADGVAYEAVLCRSEVSLEAVFGDEDAPEDEDADDEDETETIVIGPQRTLPEGTEIEIALVKRTPVEPTETDED